MKIYGTDNHLGRRLGQSFDPFENRPREEEEDYFLVVHRPYPSNSVQNELPGWKDDPHCKGVLYVKGVPNGGVNETKRGQAKTVYGDWVHFLSYAVGENGLPERNERFRRFFSAVKEENRVDWSLIDEAWPEHLVAAYLLARAVSALNEDYANHLLALRAVIDPILGNARAEYHARMLNELPNTLNSGNARAWHDKIAACLRSVHT